MPTRRKFRRNRRKSRRTKRGGELSLDQKNKIKEYIGTTLARDEVYGETSEALLTRVREYIFDDWAKDPNNKDIMIATIKEKKKDMKICGGLRGPCRGGKRRRKRRTKRGGKSRRKRRTRRRRRR